MTSVRKRCTVRREPRVGSARGRAIPRLSLAQLALHRREGSRVRRRGAPPGGTTRVWVSTVASVTSRPSRSISTPAKQARAGPESMPASTSASRSARFDVRNHSDSWNTASHACGRRRRRRGTLGPRHVQRGRWRPGRAACSRPGSRSTGAPRSGSSVTAHMPDEGFTADGRLRYPAPDVDDLDRERGAWAFVADGVARARRATPAQAATTWTAPRTSRALLDRSDEVGGGARPHPPSSLRRWFRRATSPDGPATTTVVAQDLLELADPASL